MIFKNRKRLQKTLKKAVSLLILAVLVFPVFTLFSAKDVGAYDYIATGIDVSKWQGTIDWDKVKASGVDFAILKVGSTKGMDEYFEFNYLGAKSRGLNVGAYYYTYAMSESEAAAEAETVATWLDGKTFEYPIFFDIEDPSQETLSVETRTNMCIAFNTALENRGYFAGIYASKSWLNSYLDRAALSQKYVIWEASWRNSGEADIDKSSDCQLWQYSATGTVSGISGNVDMDVSYIDYPSLIRRIGKNGFSKGNTASTVSAYYTTTASSLTVRSGPGTTYGAIDYAPNGSTVLLLDVNAAGTWAKVVYNGKIGWLSDKYLDLANPVPVEYAVSYDAAASGVQSPDAVKLHFGDAMAVAELSNTLAGDFKGWTLKRLSDNSWYTEENGWVSETDIASYSKAVIASGAALAFDSSKVVMETGNDSFVLVGEWEETFRYGDLNNDGSINSRDSVLMKLYYVGKSTVMPDFKAMDLDGDGVVNAKDLLLIKKYINGIINVFPVEQK